MINDSLAERAPVEEQASHCLALWATVLAQGIRDAARAHVQRQELFERAKQGLEDGLVQATVRLQQSLTAVERIQARLADVGLDPTSRRALERARKAHEVSIKRLEMRPALLYAGLDEPTEWLWSDSTDLGSFLQLYHLFSALPPVHEFQRMFLRDPEHFININLDKVFRNDPE